MKKALIFNNKVIQIETEFFEVHESMQWIDCDNSVQIGYEYDGSNFTNPINSEDIFNRTKENLIKQVKNNKREFIYSPISFADSTFINSEISSNNLQAVYQFSSFPLTWLDINNNEVLLTQSDTENLIDLMISIRSAGYLQEAVLLKQIESCTTLEELQKIDISFK